MKTMRAVAFCILVLWPLSAVAQLPPTSWDIGDTSRLAWTSSADDSWLDYYQAELYRKADVVVGPTGDLIPKATANPFLVLNQGKPVIDATNTQTGQPLKPFLIPGVEYVAYLRAIVGAGGSALSNSAGPFGLPAAACDHTPVIQIIDWTRTVAVGDRGRVLYKLANPLPIVQVLVKLGSQVISQVDGAELRDSAGTYFSVPRTPGTYQITVFVKDTAGCTFETVAIPRTVVVF